MKITGISSNGIKSLDNVDLAPGNLTVLLGANNAGKSALLQSIRLLNILRGENPPFLGSYIDTITNKDTHRTPFIVMKVVFEAQELQSMHEIFHSHGLEYEFKFQWISAGNHSPILVDYIKSIDKHWFPWQRRSDNQYNMVVAGNAVTSFLMDKTSAFSYFIQEMSKPFHDQTRVLALDPLRVLITKLFFYDHHRVISNSVPFGGDSRLESTGSSLARHLAIWKLGDDESFTKYSQLVDKIIPNLGSLFSNRDPMNSGNVYVGFRKPQPQGRSLELRVNSMGTGVEQILALCFQLIDRSPKVLFLEEPESHLHPSAQKALFQAIKDASAWSQIILTTHSPLFVDRETLSNNCVVQLNQDGFTRIEPLKAVDPFRRVRDVLGVSLADNLFAGEVIIVVEGASEQVCLPIISSILRESGRESIDFSRVSVVSAGGASNIKSMVRILAPFQVPIVVLVDDDSAGHKAANDCLKQGVPSEHIIFIRSLDGSTRPSAFEDSLPEEIYLTSLNDQYDTSFQAADVRAKEQELTTSRGGRLPSREEVYALLLADQGKIGPKDDYDKVGVALDVVQKMSVEQVADVYVELSQTVNALLSPSIE